jgi:hypothetical protein
MTPLRASLEALSGLPPAVIITDETRYLGTIHDFMMLPPPRENVRLQRLVSRRPRPRQRVFRRANSRQIETATEFRVSGLRSHVESRSSRKWGRHGVAGDAIT